MNGPMLGVQGPVPWVPVECVTVGIKVYPQAVPKVENGSIIW